MPDSSPPDAVLLGLIDQAVSAAGHWLPKRGREAIASAVAEHFAAELDTAQRRAIALVERIGDARVWARRLPAEQQTELLRILRGDPDARPNHDRAA
jgi:hypothetical protein